MVTAAGLRWMSLPVWSKATTPSVMWRKRVSSLVRSFSTAARVCCSTEAISLKVPVRMPISSVDSTGRRLSKSPAATFSAPAVSFSMGPTMVLERRKLRRREMRRPMTRACMMIMKSWVLRPETVSLLSRM